MKIKDILIDIKNNTDKGTGNESISINCLPEIYLKKINDKVYAKTETIKILNSKSFINYKSVTSIKNIIDKKMFFYLNIMCSFFSIPITYLFSSPLITYNIFKLIPLYLMIYFLLMLPFGTTCLFIRLSTGAFRTFLEKNCKKQYNNLIKKDYKEIYSSVSTELLKELELINDEELNPIKKNLENNIIKINNELQQSDNSISSYFHSNMILKVERKIFKDFIKPIDYKKINKKQN